MNVIKYALLVVWLIHADVTRAEISDPVGDFVNLRSISASDNESLLVIRADLNGDGVPEVLLSTEMDTNGRLGNIWMVYVSRGGKFLRSDRLITLDQDSLVVKRSKNKGLDRLFSVTSPQKGELHLTEYILSKTDIVSKEIAKILLLENEGADIMIRLLRDDNQTQHPVVKGKASELKENMSIPPKLR